MVFNVSMNESDSDDLIPKLRTWQVHPRVPKSFQREVWQRIAARQSARDDTFIRQLTRAIGGFLVRPQYALALIMVSLSVGVGIAHVQAQGAKTRQWRVLEDRYAASIDPLEMGR
jgi:hypothetical protein